ncbi:hypothetical protein [Georgenia thermotolerans]|uniref:Redoxin domain-containing protein n=1 Tax=Georgenia thermotolerans TaxID=527326 RepID=A0A7J5UMN3_9MICO|nr:hypothetical protein [Georgenia thermotolerans]KAE8763645.1 hypothetical protein GB883_13065 [Georgenia thermotolerans]
MSTQQAAARIPSFPALEGRSLLGEPVALPAGLPAERTLVLVAFQRWQQPVVDGWLSRAVAGGVPSTPHGAPRPMPVAVVELAVLSIGWKPARRFIEGGMVASSRDPEVLARTITVFTDVSAFRRRLQIPSTEEVHALVVDRGGAVLARARGEVDAETWAAVAVALK